MTEKIFDKKEEIEKIRNAIRDNYKQIRKSFIENKDNKIMSILIIRSRILKNQLRDLLLNKKKNNFL